MNCMNDVMAPLGLFRGILLPLNVLNCLQTYAKYKKKYEKRFQMEIHFNGP